MADINSTRQTIRILESQRDSCADPAVKAIIQNSINMMVNSLPKNEETRSASSSQTNAGSQKQTQRNEEAERKQREDDFFRRQKEQQEAEATQREDDISEEKEVKEFYDIDREYKELSKNPKKNKEALLKLEKRIREAGERRRTKQESKYAEQRERQRQEDERKPQERETRFYTIPQLIEETGLSEDEIKKKVREGEIKAFRDQEKIKFRADDVKDLIERHRQNKKNNELIDDIYQAEYNGLIDLILRKTCPESDLFLRLDALDPNTKELQNIFREIKDIEHEIRTEQRNLTQYEARKIISMKNRLFDVLRDMSVKSDKNTGKRL